MRLLVDINVALDVILERDPWVIEGALLFSAIQEGRAEGYLAGHTIPTIHYIVRENRRDCAVADAAVQAACATKVNADWIVSRNTRGFKKSSVACKPPGAVLAAIRADEES